VRETEDLHDDEDANHASASDHDNRRSPHSHTHGHSLPVATTLRRALMAAVGVVGVSVLIGLVVLWPRGSTPDVGGTTRYVNATVTVLSTESCPSVVDSEDESFCRSVQARLTSGPDRGAAITFTVPVGDFRAPDLSEGDRIVVFDSGSPLAAYRYGFIDFQRTRSLWWLFGIFVVVVIAFGRWQGLAALAGLAASLGVLLVFVLPAMLHGSNALAVGLVGSVLVAFIALYLAHGFTMATTVALFGTLASLLIITVLGLGFVSLAHLTGLAGEEAQILRVTASEIDLQGLLLAGIVIGALGVLDDVTVTQVSAVGELRRTNPEATAGELYRAALRIGRDHIASTVNTLALAYAGASLPLLLLFAEGSQPFGRVVGTELVAAEVVRTLVGSIGLVLSVPVTTALAAAVLAPPQPLECHGTEG
jgi:uncharacterized membrane protein